MRAKRDSKLQKREKKKIRRKCQRKRRKRWRRERIEGGKVFNFMIFIQVINNGLTFLKNNINTKTLTITNN